jgi:mRNA interferase RelE/StbE
MRPRVPGIFSAEQGFPNPAGIFLALSVLSFSSMRAVGQKYRIIYRIERGIVTVLVVALGKRQSRSREDIYELTRKLLRLGLIDLPK